MNTKNRPLIALVVVAGLLAALAGCNTVAGVGKDLERAGEKIQETTKK